jgi:3-oxoadipate enol-lactonase
LTSDALAPDPPAPGEPPRLGLWDYRGPAGAPVLVLGNSLGTGRDCWHPHLQRALARHFRVLVYEHPGHGHMLSTRAPAPPGPYTIDGLAAAVTALLDAHDVGAFHYAGLSLGGMVGMALAARAPGRVRSLTLCCTSAYLQAGYAERARAVRAGGLAPIADAVLSRWFTPAFRSAFPQVAGQFAETLAGTDPEGYAGCCEAIDAMDLRPALPGITAPTLVIAGEQDPATPPWHGAVIASAIPGARLRVIRGAAHLAPWAARGEITALLLDHLRGAQGTRTQ